MKCTNCQHENPNEALFCMKCGTKLERKCPNCGADYSEEALFCMKCGTKLVQENAPTPTEADWPVESSSPRRDAPEAERRQLTVMFCDLVGSTALSTQLDPEELREVVRDYQAVCEKVIARFEGHIAQYLGDGLLVYFGYPHAHEDNAERAVRSGLGIVAAMQRLNSRLQQERDIRLAVRVGIHTGLVVVGEIGGGERREQLALGDTPNIAARLEGFAEPNTVVISAATYQLIAGFFDFRDLGMQSFKGRAEPIEVYRVLHESAARSRLDVAAITGLTPLVGREQEVGLLLERWRQVQEGMGHVVLLSGEAGIGKSRLLQVLKEHATEQPKVAIFDRASSRSGTWLTECRCSPYHQNSALYPVIDLLERGILQFEREDSPQEKLSKLEGFLMQYSSALEEVVPLFAALLSVPLGERYASLNLTPDQQKQKTLQALLTVLMNVVSQQPVLLVVEDLHWIDPSTLELLNLVIDQGPTVRILTVLTFRPEFRPPWTPRSHLTPLTLTRLPHQQVELIVKQVTGGKALPSEVLQQVVTKTDGVPLFVEELTKMVLESGLLREERDGYELTRPLPPLAIPATLHDSLMARLDRLATVKEVAQLGATLGREFNYELIKAVSPLDDEILQRSLEQLVEVELLYQRGVPPQSTYLFKHALIQDVAYQSLLKSTRQQYHQRIVEVLHEQFPEAAETEIELLAYHYTAAGLNAQAIRYWQQAGQRAVQRSANVEAIAHFTKSLELLKTLPDTLERAQQELDLQIALGPALIATKGFAAPEVEKTYTRARELCQHVGETPQLFPVLRGLWVFYIARAEMLATRELAEQCLRVAQRQGDAAFLLEAHRLLGATLFYLGEFVPAQSHLEQTVSLYDSLQHRPDALLYGQDSAMASLSYQSWALWLCGYPDQALQRMNQAIALAKEADNPYDLAYALSFAARSIAEKDR